MRLVQKYISNVGNTNSVAAGKISTSDNLIAVICNDGVTVSIIHDVGILPGKSVKVENAISVALTDDLLVVGTNNESGDHGKVILYTIENYELMYLLTITPEDPKAALGYGTAVAIHNLDIVVSSPRAICSDDPLQFGCIHMYKLDGRRVTSHGIVTNHHEVSGSTYGGYLNFNRGELLVSVIEGNFEDSGLTSYGYTITDKSLVVASTTKLDTAMCGAGAQLVDLSYKFGNLAVLSRIDGSEETEVTLSIGRPGENMFGFVNSPETGRNRTNTIALHKDGIFIHDIKDGQLLLIFLKQTVNCEEELNYE